MNGIFWNSRGLRDLAKPLFLHDTSLEQNLDFICLLETVRNEFNNDELNHFCGNKNYLWTWNKPRGRLGCILVGVNMEVFHIANMIYGDFHVKLKLKNKDGFQWILVAVYGAAQQEYKEAFLTETHAELKYLQFWLEETLILLEIRGRKTMTDLIVHGLFILML
jgi:hypothetical protein